jgi:hypothetical protein
VLQKLWHDMKAHVIDLPTSADTAGILGLTFLNQCGAVLFRWGTRPGTATLYSRHTSWVEITEGHLPCISPTISQPYFYYLCYTSFISYTMFLLYLFYYSFYYISYISSTHIHEYSIISGKECDRYLR